MPVINVTEIDRTTYTQNAVDVDNVVFVPGTAITGPDEPTLCLNYDEFVEKFGDKAPDDNSSFGTTWDYAANILLAGFPVLFKRIIKKESDDGVITYAQKASGSLNANIPNYIAEVSSQSTVIGAAINSDTFINKITKKLITVTTYTFTYTANGWTFGNEAVVDISEYGISIPDGTSLNVNDTVLINVSIDSSESEDVEIAKIYANYEGTFGNDLSTQIFKQDGSSYIYLRTFIGDATAAVETIRLCSIGSTDAETIENIKEAIGTGLTTEYITIVLTGEDTLNIDTINPANFPYGVKVKLADGTDISDIEAVSTILEVYDSIDQEFPLSDIYIYNIKFITSGGLCELKRDETTPIALYRKMVQLAQKRGDCIAVLDVPYGTTKEELVDGTSTYFRDLVDVNCSYATAFAPWVFMSLSTKTSGKWMAPSYAFIHTLARSIAAGNKMWEIPAGVTRGTVSEVIKPQYDIGSAILDAWQNTNTQYINPIMKLRSYGYVLYGQRTLYKNVEGPLGNRSALQELGVRMIANEIKKYIIDIAINLTFEPNTVKTWLAFKLALEPYLAEMKAYGALIDYEVIMDTSNNDGKTNVVNGIVKVNIARAAEDFEIALELSAAGVTFGSEL